MSEIAVTVCDTECKKYDYNDYVKKAILAVLNQYKSVTDQDIDFECNKDECYQRLYVSITVPKHYGDKKELAKKIARRLSRMLSSEPGAIRQVEIRVKYEGLFEEQTKYTIHRRRDK